MRFININGSLIPEAGAGIQPDNRAFRYGHSLFETMLVRDGQIRLETYHWERLLTGMELLRIEAPPRFRESLQGEAMRTVTANKPGAGCRLRIQVHAGNGGLGDGGDPSAGFVIEAAPLPAPVPEADGPGLVIGVSDIIKHTGPFSHLKTGSALPYALAARQATDAGWDDALLLNEQGYVADSTIANVFWVENGKIRTPPLSDGCVSGVMRRHLLTELPRHGYDVAEQRLRLDDLERADCMFLSNSIRGVRPVKSIYNRRFPPIADQELHSAIRHLLL